MVMTAGVHAKGYFDYNASAPIDGRVQEVLVKAIQEFGNPSSLHRWGRGGKEVLEDARYRVADVMGVAPDQVVFTSGASEANNMVLQSFVPDAVVVSAIEHPSVSGVWDARVSLRSSVMGWSL